jgi:hypothetical protein
MKGNDIRKISKEAKSQNLWEHKQLKPPHMLELWDAKKPRYA